MMKWVVCFLLMSGPILGFAEMKQSTVFVPQEVFDKIQNEFGIKSFDFTPEFFDVEVSIQGGSTKEQKLKVGYTQEVLDLSSYVDKIWSEFQLTFTPPFPIDGNATMYFISRYKSMDLAKQKIGLGCGQVVVLKSKLNKFFAKKGTQMLSRAGQHIHVLGGDYLLVKKESEKIKMVYFRIRDGRWSHRLCAQ
jgi:hypothetical protein